MQQPASSYNHLVLQDTHTGNGYCFIESLHCVLLRDHQHPLSHEIILCKIEDEVIENIKYYRQFHPSPSNSDFLKQLQQYLNDRAYTIDVADVEIITVANALAVNLVIFQNIGGSIGVVLQFATVVTKTVVYLLHTHQHYNAIVDSPDIELVDNDEPIIVQAYSTPSASPPSSSQSFSNPFHKSSQGSSSSDKNVQK